MHPERDYAAAVFGTLQGSGYLLTDRLILTSRHVVEGAAVTAIVPNGVGRVSCTVPYVHPTADVALLWAERSLVADRQITGPQWGRPKDSQTWPSASAMGYPAVQVHRGSLEKLDVHQVVGRFNPGTGALAGGAVLEGLIQPAGASPWAGMSGAAVFVEGLLVGVVRSDPSAWQHQVLTLVPAAALLEDSGFIDLWREFQVRIRVRTLTAPGVGAAATFEERLRNYVATQADRLWITGARVAYGGDTGDDYWSLQDTYLGLHLAERDGIGIGQRQPAESALADKKRVLLVGSAGTGKTTLLQWLASAVARRSLPSSLSNLADCVPLLVQLRSIVKQDELPGPGQLLAAVAKPLAGHPDAAGWLAARLDEGRVLMMVDGLDEISSANRKRTRKWLDELIDAYPDNYYILATRPSTVDAGWLDQRGFAELETQPMGSDEIVELVGRWFDMVGARRRFPRRVEEVKRRALTNVLREPDIMELARSPLLCTLICALMLENDSMPLPRSRADLYDTAARMLLGSRESSRGITGSHRLGLDDQFVLLMRLAFWLSINGATEIGSDQAVKLVHAASKGLYRVSEDSVDVLSTLLIGSGMLQQTSERTIRFGHLPFQHYFTAVAALEEGSIGLLVNHAHDEEWADVLVLAAAYARWRECDDLLRALLKRLRKEPRHAGQLSKITRMCLDHAERVSPEVRAEVVSALG